MGGDKEVSPPGAGGNREAFPPATGEEIEGDGGFVDSWNDTGARLEQIGPFAGRAQTPPSRERGHSRVTTGIKPASGEDGGTVFTACHGSSSAAAIKGTKHIVRVATHHELGLVMVHPLIPEACHVWCFLAWAEPCPLFSSTLSSVFLPRY